MSSLRITIPGPPVGKGRARSGKGNHYTPDATREWESAAAFRMRRAWAKRPTLIVATSVLVLAVKQRPKDLTRKTGSTARSWRTAVPDGDNVLKAVCDALKLAGVVKDDAYFSDKRVCSLYAAEGELPCVEVDVSLIGDACQYATPQPVLIAEEYDRQKDTRKLRRVTCAVPAGSVPGSVGDANRGWHGGCGDLLVEQLSNGYARIRARLKDEGHAKIARLAKWPYCGHTQRNVSVVWIDDVAHWLCEECSK